MLYPLKLKSPLKDYIWGGTRLKNEFNKKTDLSIVAESWELACHKAGTSIIEMVNTMDNYYLHFLLKREKMSLVQKLLILTIFLY